MYILTLTICDASTVTSLIINTITSIITATNTLQDHPTSTSTTTTTTTTTTLQSSPSPLKSSFHLGCHKSSYFYHVSFHPATSNHLPPRPPPPPAPPPPPPLFSTSDYVQISHPFVPAALLLLRDTLLHQYHFSPPLKPFFLSLSLSLSPSSSLNFVNINQLVVFGSPPAAPILFFLPHLHHNHHHYFPLLFLPLGLLT